MVTISFTHEKDGEHTHTTHATKRGDFLRDELTGKFKKFTETLGYMYEEPVVDITEKTAPFDLE
jgi:hypothetical protein